jgi:hypothetical protein
MSPSRPGPLAASREREASPTIGRRRPPTCRSSSAPARTVSTFGALLAPPYVVVVAAMNPQVAMTPPDKLPFDVNHDA